MFRLAPVLAGLLLLTTPSSCFAKTTQGGPSFARATDGISLHAEGGTAVAVTEADVVEINLIGERTRARGNAHLTYEGIDLRADEVVANRTTGELEANGHLVVIQQARRLTGSSISYNLHTGIGTLKHARATEQGVIIIGEELSLAPDKIVARHAQLTTCNDPEPHYAFKANQITLTARQITPGKPPKAGRLTLDRARVTYHGRALFTVPRYSVSVGDLGKKESTPLPTTGFSRADGPFTTIGYTLGTPESKWSGRFSYRYTTLRGIRGYMVASAPLGPTEFTFGYHRRQDPGDREIEPDDLEASTKSVLVNREPEYGVILPELQFNKRLSLQASWLTGRYSERLQDGLVERAQADRTSLTVLLKSAPYRISPSVELSHAIGWRRSTYSPGDQFTVKLYRHSIAWRASPKLRLKLSHVTRDDSGETPFLFDGIPFRREIIGEVGLVVNPAWRMRFVDYYDPETSRARDMLVEATRTAHCLEYTIGWRKERGAFYIGFGLAPPTIEAGAVPSP